VAFRGFFMDLERDAYPECDTQATATRGPSAAEQISPKRRPLCYIAGGMRLSTLALVLLATVHCSTPEPRTLAPQPVASASAKPDVPGPTLETGGARTAVGEFGMVTSDDAHATRVAADILARGGNAVDAAVALGYTLGVTYHTAGGLGGGGFMVVRLADGRSFAIDYRETAPAAAGSLDAKQLAAGARGFMSAPVPGVVAGLNLARERFGTMSLAALLEPAIALARDGHTYSPRQALALARYWPHMRDPGIRAMMGRGEQPLTGGEYVKQPVLAQTLQTISDKGNAGFYRGKIARRIAAAHEANDGVVTEADLARYRARIRKPIAFDYRGFTIVTMPPPSMGGIALASILLARERLPGEPPKAGSAAGLHLFIEASRRAYADRRAVGADPDIERGLSPFLARLLDVRYYAEREPAIDPTRATRSSAIVPIQYMPAALESSETTHFSVVDVEGNAVSCTTTLSSAFGALVSPPDTGIILSNAMVGFSIGGVNTLAPNKRMASSMTPTIVLGGSRVVAVLGTPGGDSIPGSVAQVLLNLIDHRMTIDKAIDAPRVHHQFMPDEVRVELARPFAPLVLSHLRFMGHHIRPSFLLGSVNGIVVDPQTHKAWGHSDSRKAGLSLGPSSLIAP